MKGVIYARYSSDNQREESIDGQVRECLAYTEKNGIQIIETYIDRAMTAKTDKRPDFQRMIKDSYKKGFDVVIVWKLDRFARNRFDSAKYKMILRQNEVRVLSATEAISSRPEGILMESMLEGWAEYYSAELAEKVIRGQTENALKCKSNGGTLPFGYYVDGEQHFQINLDTAPFVCVAFQMYDEGYTMKEIAADFKRRGVKNTRGTDFTINTISNMLSNRRYIGEYKYRDIVIPDGIPAIVDKDLFDRVQQQIEKNKKAPARYKADADYILTTKLYCGNCKSFMVGESGTSRNSTTYRYYKCITAKRKKGCDKKAVKKDWIEDIVINQIKKVIFDDDLIEAIAESVYQLQDQENTMVPLLRKQLAETEKSIENVLNAIEQGIITPSTKQRLEELEQRKQNLQIEIAKENIKKPVLTKEQILFWLHRFRNIDTDNIKHRKRLVDSFVNSVVLYDDRIEFFFNYKDGAKTLTLEELSKSSDLLNSAPPKNRVRITYSQLVEKAQRKLGFLL